MVLTLTNFSESPLHLLTMVEAEILKNVVLHSVATAFASIVFPVPADRAVKKKKKKFYEQLEITIESQHS